MRQLIETTGLQPRLELFARRRIEGWDSMGFDIDGCDIKKSLNRLIL